MANIKTRKSTRNGDATGLSSGGASVGTSLPSVPDGLPDGFRSPEPRSPESGSWSDNPEREELNAAHLQSMEDQAEQMMSKGSVQLPELQIKNFEVDVIGDSELITHRWSEKAIKEILDKQMGLPSAGREAKKPVEEFLSTLYTILPGRLQGNYDDSSDDGHPDVWIEGGKFGFPSIAFKNAMVTACTSLGKKITKVQARQCFHVVGELIEVQGVPRMRRDMVRLASSGSADVRFRAGFKPGWRCRLRIRYNSRVLSAAQIVNLLNTAGFAVGVGEWRSEKDGSFGLFHVAEHAVSDQG